MREQGAQTKYGRIIKTFFFFFFHLLSLVFEKKKKPE